MRDDMLEIAARIRTLLEERGATQADLARVIGLDQSSISKLLAGHRGLAATELGALCEHYGVRSDRILFGARDEPLIGAVLRPDFGPVALAMVEAAFADYRYVKALVGGR